MGEEQVVWFIKQHGLQSFLDDQILEKGNSHLEPEPV
jgi:hypothetical protein